MNVDQNLLETEFLIAICRPLAANPNGDKWQSKTLSLRFFIDCQERFRLAPTWCEFVRTILEPLQPP